MTLARPILCFAALAALPVLAAAQEQPQKPSDIDKAGKIVSQPARDIGAVKTRIPPPLEEASTDPYATEGLATCPALAARIDELDGVLGPDFGEGERNKTSLAELGGRAVVNSLIPFRGIVREVSGAAAADRRLEAAVEAGLARRGFLRGLYLARNCSPAR